MHRHELKSKGRATKYWEMKSMEWRRAVELSEGMVQRANEPECYGKESQVGAKE